MRQPHFKKIESYKHRFAIETLQKWIADEPELIGVHFPVTTRDEVEFKINRKIYFVADLVVYMNDQIYQIFEIVHTHAIDEKKLNRIYEYQTKAYKFFLVYEISAEWILRQIGIPYILKTERTIFDIRFKKSEIEQL